MPFIPNQAGTSTTSFSIGSGHGKVPLTLDASLVTSSYSLVLPPAQGSNGQVLSLDGSGNLVWSTPSVGTGTVTSVSGSGGTTGLTLTGGPITTSGTLTLGGTLAIANGGTGQTTASGAINALVPSQTGNNGKFLSSNGSVVSWLQTVTSVDGSGGTTGLSFSGGPIINTGTLTLTGTLNAVNGGTGFTTYTTGDLIYSSASNVLSKLAIGTTGQALVVTGGVPAWGTVTALDARLATPSSATYTNPTVTNQPGNTALGHLAVISSTSTTGLNTAIGYGAVIGASAGNTNTVVGPGYCNTVGSSNFVAGTGNSTSFGITGSSSSSVVIGFHSLLQSGQGNALVLGSGNTVGAAAGANGSTVVGQSNTVPTDLAFVFGTSNTTTGTTGYQMIFGTVNTTTLTGQMALGNAVKPDHVGQIGISIGDFAAAGDAGTSLSTGRMQTTTATPTEIGFAQNTSTAPTNRIILTNNSTYIFDVDIVARKSTTGTDYAAWNLKFLISREANAAATAIVGTVTKTLIGATSGAVSGSWDVSATADTTNGRPNISVTGQASTTIRWVATIKMTKVSG